MSLELAGYRYLKSGGELPPIDEGLLYEYVTAANGLFVRGRREGLEALVPVVPFLSEIRSLDRAHPYVRLLSPYRRVECSLLEQFLDYARAACLVSGSPKELVVFFRLDEQGRWHIVIPRQLACRDELWVTGGASAYEGAFIEAHSHPETEMAPDFSPGDDADEGGFGVYAVLGDIWRRPTLRTRVGIYGHRFEIPADIVFHLPSGMRDAVPNVWGLALPGGRA